MSLSVSPLSYEDCFQIMATALEDAKGARVNLATEDAATFFRMRCHQARALDRKQNLETYPAGDPRHGVSQYDRLTLRLYEVEGSWWVYIEQNAVIPGRVELLSNGEAVQFELPAAEPQRQLPAPEPYPQPEADLGEAFDALPTVAEPEVTPPPRGFRRL